jgi:hypothetical protein
MQKKSVLGGSDMQDPMKAFQNLLGGESKKDEDDD